MRNWYRIAKAVLDENKDSEKQGAASPNAQLTSIFLRKQFTLGSGEGVKYYGHVFICIYNNNLEGKCPFLQHQAKI